LKLEYHYACKIHTKQDTGSSLGFDWCRDMLDKMLVQTSFRKLKRPWIIIPTGELSLPKGMWCRECLLAGQCGKDYPTRPFCGIADG
jgi:hypothetical protein